MTARGTQRAADRDDSPADRRSMRALMWGGLILSLTLMVAATALTLLAEKRWGLYLFVGAAVLYLLCRCATIGLLNTAPKALTVVFLIAGSFILSKWPPLSAMGILGMACLGASLACVLLYGLGLARQRPSPPPRGD